MTHKKSCLVIQALQGQIENVHCKTQPCGEDKWMSSVVLQLSPPPPLIPGLSANLLEPSAFHLKADFLQQFWLVGMGWDLSLQTSKKLISLMRHLLFWQKALELLMKTNLRVLTVLMPCFRESLGMQTLSLRSVMTVNYWGERTKEDFIKDSNKDCSAWLSQVETWFISPLSTIASGVW